MENPNGKESKITINGMFDQRPYAIFMSMLTMSSHSGACAIHSPPEIKVVLILLNAVFWFHFMFLLMSALQSNNICVYLNIFGL